MKRYEKYMRQCFRLAKKGEGKTSPNPLVGCVVLNKSGDIISSGYHKKYGDNHAERDALLKLKNGEEKDGTLIVNLEPCNHYGKTPPCTDLIIERGIKTVVISSLDTNPVATGGIQKLESAGITVLKGVLENEGNILNEMFFTNIKLKRPFIALKTATTIDGKIATKTGDSKWITSEKSRNYARKLRTKYDAILTSSATVLADNPKMLHKTKIILDSQLRCDLNKDIFKSGQVLVFNQKTSEKASENAQIEYIKCPIKNNKLDLNFIIEELYKRKIMSVFVEAGGELLGSFLKEGYVDKLYHFVAPKIINDNNAKSAFNGDIIEKISDSKIFISKDIKKIDSDILVCYSKLQ